jgi:hypothetical protein
LKNSPQEAFRPQTPKQETVFTTGNAEENQNIFYHGRYGIHGNNAKCGGFHFPAEKSFTAEDVLV